MMGRSMRENILAPEGFAPLSDFSVTVTICHVFNTGPALYYLVDFFKFVPLEN